ncbi:MULTISPECIES: hypothetical protein [unclassified Pseudomonas]|uniref:hypothetical protein n=1 Tax=unclassified Pseudomonas TaxID=196821 RepID=UPI002447DEBF|nr:MULTISPECIES: hypothetical protein [unclassified Pseudomonas]MDG9926341.1 hypothetical protein [Pseudomonas sp. GD04045]MDH0037590.1 hypothetical protein [Pseudomonas sp. GD04019]
MNSQENFRDALRVALVDCAALHFEEAARYAHANGLEAHTQLRNDERPELHLTLKRPSDGVPCIYRIGALTERNLVLHEKIYGQEVQRLEAPLESINQTLVETELAAFFIKAAALPLDYVAERHQPGFI